MHEIIEGLPFVPKTATWELTLRCNLNCGHCGSSAGKARPDEMSREVALRVAGELAAMGCKRISLSGGEPTLSPYWQDIAAEGARLGVYVNMITNALSTDRELVRRAKDHGLRTIGVSLDGLEAEHDANRGRKGLYGRVMQLLDDGAAVDLPMGVITTITKDNLHDLEAMHDLLVGKVYAWQLQAGARMGNLASHDEKQIEPKDLLEVVPTLAHLIEKDEMRIHVADNIGYYGPYEKTLRTRRTSPVPCWVGCYAGCQHIGIEADGGVKGCLSLQSTAATEGNVQGDSLHDIWWKRDAFAYNRSFSPSDLSGFCRTCEHVAICRGGCLSMRSCEGGRDNPFCYHRVATLASRKKERSRRHYVPMVVAPAALMAAFGLGCDDSDPPRDAGTDTQIMVDADGSATDGRPGIDAAGSDSAPTLDAASYYGMVEDSAPAADATDDVGPSPDGGSWYGFVADADADES